MKTKIPHLILAGLLGTTLASQAFVLYQSDFTGTSTNINDYGLTESVGAAGSFPYWVINTTEDRLDGRGSGNARANVFTTNSFALSDAPTGHKGIQLSLTFYGASNLTRHSMGLVDGDFNIAATAGDWLNQSLAGAYGVGFTTAGEGDTFLGGDGLLFNNDAGDLTALSTAQGDKIGSFRYETLVITLRNDNTWSYSLNGQTATTGTFASEFDLSRDFRFASYAQRTSRAQYTNITISAIPEPSSTALFGLGGLALMLRRKRSR
jgi:hypothetical protein